MKNKILNINIPEALPLDFDPLLERSVSEYFGTVHRISPNAKPKTSISVFDNDIGHQTPPAVASDDSNKPVEPQKSEEVGFVETKDQNTVTEDLSEITETELPENLSEKPIDEEIAVSALSDFSENLELEVENSENIEASLDTQIADEIEELPPVLVEIETNDLTYDNSIATNSMSLDTKQERDFNTYPEHDILANQSNELEFDDESFGETKPEDPFVDETHIEPAPQSATYISKRPNPPKVLSEEDIEQILGPKQSNNDTEAQDTKPSIEAKPELEKQEKPRQKPTRKKPKPKSATPKKPISPPFLFGGIFFSGLGALLLATTMLAPLGAPFDDISSLSLYWFGLSILGFVCWIGTRRIPWMIISGLLATLYVSSIIPWMGIAPKGGNSNRHTIGFANIENNDKAFTQTIKDAEKNNAELILLANASRLKSAPDGWELVSAANPQDPTSLAVLGKAGWRATTQLGEPIIAKPNDNWLTIIGANPKDPSTIKRTTPEREALINRTANRAGMEDGPVLVVGDFAATPWDRAMQDFTKTSGLLRIRCGGYFGTTFSKGVFGVAYDHAYFKNLNVQACKIGARLEKSNHSAIFVSIAPKGGK